MKLALAIKYLYPDAKEIAQWSVEADEDGRQFIRHWSLELGQQPTPEEIASAELPSVKAERIETDRAECRRRLTQFYGDALEQVSRASGIYGETARTNHETGVQAAIDASNSARDLINAATTVEQVESITVTWPVLV